MGDQAGNTALAQQVSDLLAYWRDKAEMHGAAEPSDEYIRCSFVLSGDRGAIRAFLGNKGGARLFVSSLIPFFGLVGAWPDRVVEVDRQPKPLSDAGQRALLELLDPQQNEVAPLIHVPYGFVVNDRIVAITFTTSVDEQSQTDRTTLGLNADTYVAHADAFRQLYTRPAASRVEWYRHFWELAYSGHVVNLSQRVRRLPGQIWSRREGPEVWLEVDATDGEAPDFMTDSRYVAWDWQTNEPSLRERLGSSSQRHQLKAFFQ